MNCPFEQQIDRFYDDGLVEALSPDVALHVKNCAECAAHLAELQKLGAMIRSAPRVEMSSDALRRLEQSWWRQRDRGVLRLAEWLTVAAAAVIMLNLLFLPQSSTKSNPEGGNAWQAAAFTPPAQSREDASGDVVAVAEWMANDLSEASH